MITPALFITPMLLIRGCPINKIDEACAWLEEQTIPGSPSAYIEQIDQAIHAAVYDLPRPTHEHQWTTWHKDRGFFSLDRQEARECLKCGVKEHRDWSH